LVQKMQNRRWHISHRLAHAGHVGLSQYRQGGRPFDDAGTGFDDDPTPRSDEADDAGQ
jgi:hypothetical protein